MRSYLAGCEFCHWPSPLIGSEGTRFLSAPPHCSHEAMAGCAPRHNRRPRRRCLAHSPHRRSRQVSGRTSRGRRGGPRAPWALPASCPSSAGGSTRGGRGRAGPCPQTPRGNPPCMTRPYPTSGREGPMRGHGGQRFARGGGSVPPRNPATPAGAMATGRPPSPPRGGGRGGISARIACTS